MVSLAGFLYAFMWLLGCGNGMAGEDRPPRSTRIFWGGLIAEHAAATVGWLNKYVPAGWVRFRFSTPNFSPLELSSRRPTRDYHQ